MEHCAKRASGSECRVRVRGFIQFKIGHAQEGFVKLMNKAVAYSEDEKIRFGGDVDAEEGHLQKHLGNAKYHISNSLDILADKSRRQQSKEDD